MSEIEREIIERCLKQFKGNRRKTSEALEISERTLYRKIKEFDLSPYYSILIKLDTPDINELGEFHLNIYAKKKISHSIIPKSIKNK